MLIGAEADDADDAGAFLLSFRSSEMDGVWAHDKYEELIDMETETEPVPT